MVIGAVQLEKDTPVDDNAVEHCIYFVDFRVYSATLNGFGRDARATPETLAEQRRRLGPGHLHA
jgi:hypothetical protein